MGFDIPEPFKWDKSFEVFYQSLDEEHKGLFDAIFNLAKSPSDNGVLTKLAQLIDTHFHNEEAMMKKANYGDFESHHNAHDDFVATLKNVTTPVNDAQLHWAKDWLVTHIKGTDFKYKGKL